LVKKHSEFIGFPIEFHAEKFKEGVLVSDKDGENEQKKMMIARSPVWSPMSNRLRRSI